MVDKPKFKQFDYKQYKDLLDKAYEYGFVQYDGFSYRMLQAIFLVDQYYNFTLYIRSSENAKNYEPAQGERGIRVRLEGRLPNEIYQQYLKWQATSVTQLQDDYGYPSAKRSKAVGTQLHLINSTDFSTKSVLITDDLEQIYFATEAERGLYDWNQYLKSWIENIYLYWKIQ